MKEKEILDQLDNVREELEQLVDYVTEIRCEIDIIRDELKIIKTAIGQLADLDVISKALSKAGYIGTTL